MIGEFTEAAAYLANSGYWGALFIGVTLSALSGLVPGLSSPVVMAMALPYVVFTIHDPVNGLVLLAIICGASNTLDSIPAITMGIPGAATQVTYLEGHQLARKGRAAHTLGAVYAVSAVGGLVGALCLLVAIPVIRPFILAFSFGEIAAVAFLGLAFIGVLSRGAKVKGLAAALLGLLMGTIGIAPGTGAERFTFGELFLWQGLPMIAVVSGVLALPELIDLLIRRQAVAGAGAAVSFADVRRGFMDGLRRWRMAIRQSALGAGLGAVPGVGAPVIDWMAYSFGILFSRDRTQFGKGSLDGVLFSESAQNAKEGGQAIPTLALGIPGGTTWAIVATAMLAYQVAPGPQMLDQSAHITIVLVITLALGNLGVTMMGLAMTPVLGRLTLIPYAAIGAVAIPLVVVAAYLSTSDWRALVVAGAFTVIALMMKRFGWPRPPLIIGFILGPIIEENLLNAISVHGGLLPALARPFTLSLLAIAVIVAIGFQWLMARGVPQNPSVGGSTILPAVSESGGAAVVLGRRGFGYPRSGGGMPQFHLRWEHLPVLGVLIVAAVFLWNGRDLASRAQLFPDLISVGLLALAAFEFVRTGLSEPERGQILDLGLISTGAAGARQASLVVLALFIVFAAVAVVFGLPYGAIAFSILCALTLMPERGKLPVTAVAGTLVAVFLFVFIEDMMGVVWPDSLY
jgi:TctA family transporter